MRIYKNSEYRLSEQERQELLNRKVPTIGELYLPEHESHSIWCIIAVAEHYADPSLQVVVYFDLNADEANMNRAYYATTRDFCRMNLWCGEAGADLSAG